MSKASILLVPGSFAIPEFYAPVVDAVAGKGYEIWALHYPNVGLKTGQGREGVAPTMYDDAAFIAKEAERLADDGKDVILIGHSYSGVPVTQSVKGLGIKHREKQGKAGGIVRLAYITSTVPAVGMSMAGMMGDVSEEYQLDMKIDEVGWMHHAEPAATAAVILQHLSPVEGEAWVKKFHKHSAVSFAGELTYAGYNDVPISFLLCEEDLCISPKIQRAGIELMEKESGRKVDVTSVKTGHCPNITATQEVIDWIVDVAGRAKDHGVVA